ncbi:MAG: 2Fe-2S iron-sulfur cluster-binding protein, partial [Bacilli bacterium]|nr:2Fe-2S iron-sulfur cluster-binding protein [Bacilli bacterium]
MSNVKIWINNQEMTVPSTYTVLDAANDADIYIPRLCFLKDISETSACRLCVVEIEGLNTLKNSCTVQVWEGMKVHTNTKRVNDAVKNNLKLLAANHHFECWVCHREENC